MEWSPRDAERFWSRVDRSGPCWLWRGGTFRQGYGMFHAGLTGRYGAHRVAYELTHGSLPPGTSVRQRCGVRTCCNPSHLVLGQSGPKLTADQVQAIRARYAAGERQAALAAAYGVGQRMISSIVTGVRWHSAGPLIRRPSVRGGACAPRAKLTWEQVDAIRARYAAGGVTQKALGAEYGVHENVIAALIRGRTWAEHARPPDPEHTRP